MTRDQRPTAPLPTLSNQELAQEYQAAWKKLKQEMYESETEEDHEHGCTD